MEAQAQLNDGDFFLVFYTIRVLEVETDELLLFACKQTLIHFDGPLNLCDVVRVHDIQLRRAWHDVLELSCKDLDVVHGGVQRKWGKEEWEWRNSGTRGKRGTR